MGLVASLLEGRTSFFFGGGNNQFWGTGCSLHGPDYRIQETQNLIWLTVGQLVPHTVGYWAWDVLKFLLA